MAVTDREWEEILRYAPALQREPGARYEFERLLGEVYSETDWTERAHARKRFVDRANAYRLPTEKRVNPFFELAWIRAVEHQPSLAEPRGMTWSEPYNRGILWTAYFIPKGQITTARRKEAREEWIRRHGDPTNEEADLWYGDSP